jgi:uncharacterized membrane protein
MNKNEYLGTLKRLLTGLREEEIRDILYDYEEHFRIGAEEGKTEEEIAEELGNVRDTARMYKSDIPTQTPFASTPPSNNALRAILLTLALGFFNLVFVLGPYLGFAGVLIGFWGAALGITIGGVGSFILILLAPVFPGFINMAGLSYPFTFSISIGLTCLGLLFAIGSFYLTRWFFNITLRYLKWNVDTISNRRNQNV